MSHLHQFLFLHKTDNKASHVSMIYPKGKFMIRDEDKENLWKLYNSYENPRGIGEMVDANNIPILVDADLKVETNENPLFLENRMLFTLDHVKNLIRIYQKVLTEIVHNLDERHLICFLLEKKAYLSKSKDKTYLKNGFHLHFPCIFLNKNVHENDLLPRIRMEIKKLSASELPNIPHPENMIDKNYLKNPWLLYGSQKENNEPYRVTCAFDSKTRLVEDWQNLFEDYNLYNASTREKINFNVFDIEAYLPEIFSVWVHHRQEYVYEAKPDLPLIKIPSKPTGMNNMKKITTPDNIMETSKLVDGLMECISDERAEDRNDWMQIGWILFNIFHGGQEGYEKWLEFSKRSLKFQESICFYEWNKMQRKNLTIASLKYTAKDDNPEQYNKVISEFCLPLLDKCLKLDGTHSDLAQALFQKYECEFVCSSVTNKKWYQFKNHIWQKVDSGYTLSKKISEELVTDYENIAKDIVLKIRNCDEEEAKAEKKRLNAAVKLIKNLKSAPFKSNIMKEAMEVFFEDDFENKLNTNPYLIAFHNGVYDITEHVFREGRPTDYLSIKMNISYHGDLYTHDGKEVKELYDYFEKIFPDKDVREYFLDSAAEIFIGGNFNKHVQIWTGEGDNGKSITQMIFEQLLGPYNVKLPTSLLVGKRTQSSAACPELVRAGNGVRFAMLQEPDKKDVINIGILKELSGNDSFFARGLYKEGQEINPMFKVVLICNEPPKLTNSDKATWNRIKLIPFESTFCHDAPETYEEQLLQKRFPMDGKFKDKIPRMIPPLAWFLLDRLKNKPRCKKEPLKVTLATANYKKKNDIFKQFADEWVEEKEGRYLQCFEMYATFREWQKQSCPNGTCPDKNEFQEYFVKLWGPCQKDGWQGRYLRGPVDNS